MYTTEGTSYTNTSAKAGKTYYYKVKAIAKNESANSEFSVTKYRTCDLERPELTVKLSDDKPVVKWDAIDGAKEYEVKVYTGKNLIKTVTTTDTQYVFKKANEGTDYYFKVTALHKKSAANSATAESKTISCPKESESTPSTELLAEYVGTYIAYDTYNDGYGGGEPLNKLTLDENGIVRGGQPFYFDSIYSETAPTSIIKNADGSITCTIASNERYVIYPVGVDGPFFPSDTVRIEYTMTGGGVIYIIYYKVD